MNPLVETVKDILLVEDDLREAELTLSALDQADLAGRVVVVHDGEEALDYLFRRGRFAARTGGNPSVVFLDNKMPKITGLEVLKVMRAEEHLRVVPVVVFSSSRQPRDLIAFYQQGVNGYVVKPLDFTEFCSTVRQLGSFWANVNQPPPSVTAEGLPVQYGIASTSAI